MPAVESPRPAVESPRPAVESPRPAVESPKPAVEPKEPNEIPLIIHDIDDCMPRMSSKFPYSNNDLVEALHKQGVRVGKTAKRERLCNNISGNTMKILAELRRNRTRKNKKPSNGL
jgi:hypothetical protein